MLKLPSQISSFQFFIDIQPHQGIAHPVAGRYAFPSDTLSCTSWQNGSSTQSGTIIAPAAAASVTCDALLPLACCSTPYRETFAGFTTAHVNGERGGRGGMNLICGSEFAGSHICHTAEYIRAHSTTSPPVSAAWIDGSVLSLVGHDSTTPAPGREHETLNNYFGGQSMGRLVTTAWGSASNCRNWTSSEAIEQGSVLPQAYDTCAAIHAVACCR